MFLQLQTPPQSGCLGKGQGSVALSQAAFEWAPACCHPRFCGQAWPQVVGWVSRLPQAGAPIGVYLSVLQEVVVAIFINPTRTLFWKI